MVLVSNVRTEKHKAVKAAVEHVLVQFWIISYPRRTNVFVLFASGMYVLCSLPGDISMVQVTEFITLAFDDVVRPALSCSPCRACMATATYSYFYAVHTVPIFYLRQTTFSQFGIFGRDNGKLLRFTLICNAQRIPFRLLEEKWTTLEQLCQPKLFANS